LGTHLLLVISNIISSIDDLDNVAYCSMVLEIKKDLTAGYDSTYDFGAALDATDVKSESVRLFIDGSYVTHDNDNGDGTGSFTSAGGYTISGTVNYSTGVLNVDISPTPSKISAR